jgi:hypothetical protein
MMVGKLLSRLGYSCLDTEQGEENSGHKIKRRRKMEPRREDRGSSEERPSHGNLGRVKGPVETWKAAEVVPRKNGGLEKVNLDEI